MNSEIPPLDSLIFSVGVRVLISETLHFHNTCKVRDELRTLQGFTTGLRVLLTVFEHGVCRSDRKWLRDTGVSLLGFL
jgi:hypothetical protein